MNSQEYHDAKLREAVERLPRMEGNTSVIEAAERQMQAGLLGQQDRQQTAPPSSAAATAAGVGPYLTISRESGAGGGQIARLVGEATGWEVLDL